MTINTSKKSLCVMYLLLIAILTVFLNCKDSNPVILHIPVENIILSNTQISLEVGETRKLVVTVSPENATNQELIWASEDDEIATVSDDGMITGVSYGEVIIYISIPEEKIKVSCEVTVRPIEVPVTGVRLDHSFLSLKVGDSETLTATIEPENATNQDVIWTSSDENVAFVSDDGVISAVSVGITIITVITMEGGFTATCEIIVSALEIPVTGISLNHSSLTLEIGGSETLIATIEPENATNQNVLWTSSDENVAFVSVDGIISAVSEGETIITVISEEGGFTATCEVIVFYEPEIIVFTVENTEQWMEVVDFIKGNGNNKYYEINVIDDFSIPGVYPDSVHGPTFGRGTDLYISISGKRTLRPNSTGSVLFIGPHQNISIIDITFDYKDSSPSRVVVVQGEGAVFTMRGDTSIKNSGAGGVEVINNGTLIMYDGIISENSNSTGFGVGVRVTNNSTFIMHGGSVSNNRILEWTHQPQRGAGIYISKNSTFIMYDGIISGNETNSIGFIGGVYIVENSSFTMFGGEISNNFGGIAAGVGIRDGGAFFMYGGTISGNRGGCGVSSTVGFFSTTEEVNISNVDNNFRTKYSVKFIMYGGIIYGNEESGVPPDLANPWATGRSYTDHELKYGDGTDILPHTDGFEHFTRHTVIGRQ
ncbi:MAG: Ig-like domain-containing protein [Candidatus Cloacimonetes bacterium]|nr:Ig-like domain-containing protein [Candidatus Cloacimonadota bacterium]